jgi:heat shock protein HtpX
LSRQNDCPGKAIRLVSEAAQGRKIKTFCGASDWQSAKGLFYLARLSRPRGEGAMTGNRLKTLLLLAALTALVLFIGQAIGGRGGLMIAIVLAGAMNFISYWWSDKIVLRMYHAQEVTEAEAPELHGIVRELAQRANIPMPRVYIIPEETPNAFATGRNPKHAAVAVTVGLMRMLDRRELAGVIGHELSHVMNRDTLIMTVAAALAGALGYLA